MNKKFDTIIFRCFFNHGDLHAARSFIRYIKDNIHGYNFKLMHPRHIKTIGDLNIPLIWKPVDNKFDNRGYHIEFNSLIINTQYLAFNGKYFNRYSASVLTLWGIFNHTMYEVFGIELPNDMKIFLPKVDYNWYDIKLIDKDISYTEGMKKILICNNEFGSEQAIRFDFDKLIESIADTYPNVIIYVSNKTNVYRDNIKYISDILGECDGCDLNEISYLSTKCDIIIGRNSGPHTFSYVAENMMNKDKTFISFSPPSKLYGNNPKKWIDFGSHMFLDENNRASFMNVMEIDDNKRIIEVCKILEERL